MTQIELEDVLKKAEAHNKTGNYDEAVRLANSILEKIDTLPDDNSLKFLHARALLSLGQTAWRRGNYNEALVFANDALNIAERASEYDNDAIQSRAFNLIGLVHWNRSDYQRALDSYAKAISAGEKSGQKESVASVTGNIGIVYANLADYTRALEYFSKALSAHEEVGMKSDIARVLCNIGIVHRSLENYALSLKYFLQSLHSFEELGNKAEAARLRGNIGHVCVQLGEFDEAFEHYTKALPAHEEIGMKADTAQILGSLGALYSHRGFSAYNPETAKEYLLQAIELDKQLGVKHDLYENHKIIAELYREEENWKDFARHFEEYYTLEKEVQCIEATKLAHKFAAERDVAVMQKEQEILRIKNAELATLNLELEEKNNELTQLNAEKNEFLGIAAHDLKNPLNSITMIATILESELTHLSLEEIHDFAVDIRKSSTQMFDLIINLLDVNKIDQGQTALFTYPFSPLESVRSVVGRYTASAQKKEISINLSAEETKVNADENILMQVLDNLVSNAVKYSPSGKQIYVSVEKLG